MKTKTTILTSQRFSLKRTMLLLTLLLGTAFAWQAEAQTQGATCDAPLVVSSLPFTDSGNTSTYGDDYSSSDIPPVAPGAVTNGSSHTYYLNGDEAVYAYTPNTNQILLVTVEGVVDYSGVLVFTGCPFDSTVGYHVNGFSGGDLEIEGLPVEAGETYYIVISTWADPQSTDYVLNIQALEDCEGTPEAGTAAIDPNTGPSGTVAQITVEGYTAAAGITQRWEAKDENGDWEDAGLGNSDDMNIIFSGEQGDIIELRYAVTCSTSGETAYSNVISFTIDNVNCVPQYTSTIDYLSVINSEGAVSDISYSASSQPSGGYADETTTVLEAYAGQFFDINTTYVGGNNTVNIWIDWDGSGTFEESEKTGPTNGGANQVLELNVPQGVDNGEYIMRVRGVYDYYGELDPGPCSTESYGSAVDFTVSVVDSPTCPNPTGLAVDNIGETTVDIAWDDTNTAQYWNLIIREADGEPYEPTQGDITEADLENTPYTKTGLTPNTDYEVYIIADCDMDWSNFVGPVTFTTLATPPDNDTCDDAMELVCGDDPVTVSSDGSTAEAPDGCSIGDNGIWFSFVGTGGDITINSSADFDHEMSITSGSCADLIEIDCEDSSVSTETYTVEASVADQMYYVYIARYNSGSTITGNITIDIDCAAAVECPAPTALTVDNITETSANFSWTTNATQSDIYLVESTEPAPDENSTPTDTGVTSPITLDNLMSNTAYDAYVRSDCGAEGVSDWAGPETFTTLVTAPDNDDCSGAIALVCDQPITGNTLGATASGLDATCGNFTSSSALDLFYSFEADGTSDYTVSVDATPGNYSDFVLFVYSGVCGDLTEIGCADDGNPETMELLAPDAGTYYVRFFRYSGTAEFILNLECSTAVTCPAPTDLAVDNMTENSAELSWITSATQSDVYLVEASEPAPDENSTPTDTGVTSPITLDNLTANTAYDVYVRSDCGGAEGVSDWAGPVSFTTLATPPVNDDCSNAIALSCGDSVNGTTVGATESDLGSPTCAGGTPADVFYTLDVTAGTEYTVTVQGADYDAVLAIYSGECGNLVEIDCADNGFSAGVEETITYTPDTDGTIVIRTYDWSSSQGSFTISVSCEAGQECEAPEFTAILMDEDGNELDCVEEGFSYYIELSLNGGAGNDSYQITDEDGMIVIEEAVIGESYMIYESGTNVTHTYTATGNDNADCSVEVSVDVDACEPASCEDPYNEDAATSDVFISNIEFTGIGIDVGNTDYDFNYSSNTMSPNGYVVITNPTLTVYPGLEGEYTVSSGPAGNSGEYYYSVWVDFDQDGCFDAVNELVILSNNTVTGGGIPNGQSGVLDVPITWEILAPGTYQARIRNSMIDHPLAEGNGDGEALDFTIEVISEADARRLLGVESQVFTDFTYHPNPVKDQLILNASAPIEQVDVYNLIGQKVIQKQPNALEASLATDQLQAGVYLMSVTIDGSQKTFRVVKE